MLIKIELNSDSEAIVKLEEAIEENCNDTQKQELTLKKMKNSCTGGNIRHIIILRDFLTFTESKYVYIFSFSGM